MPTIPCDVRIICPGSDDPLSNYSSEAPDVIRFGAVGWSPPPIDPPLPPPPPPDGVPNFYLVPGCISLCFSSVSLEDAILCANRQAVFCAFGGGGGILGTSTRVTVPTNQVQQCIYRCPDGTGFVTTVGSGTFAAATQDEADRIAANYACEIAAHSFICLGNIISTTCVGSNYLSGSTAGGGDAPITFTIESGELPPGLVMSTGSDGRTFIISGTPTTAGVYAFHIAAKDATGHTLLKLYTITVTGIDQTTLPSGKKGTAYSQVLTAHSMTIPLTWSVSTGTLPAGLSLNSASGEIFGTPTGSGASIFTIRVVDGTGLTCSSAFTIDVTTGLCDSSVDWINNPGACRLRIKNFVPGSIVSCPECTNGVGVEWDGTFPNFVGAGSYHIAPGTVIAGKNPNFGSCNLNYFIGTGQWFIQLACAGAGRYTWIGKKPAFELNPIGIYLDEGQFSCVHTTVEVEAYTP